MFSGFLHISKKLQNTALLSKQSENRCSKPDAKYKAMLAKPAFHPYTFSMILKIKGKSVFSKNSCGLLLCALACILFWLPYEYYEQHFLFRKAEHLFLRPTLLSGFLSLAFITCLYIRGIFQIQRKKTAFASFLINLTLFATLFEIFISQDRAHTAVRAFPARTAAVFAFMAAIIFFGGKEIAKITCLLLPLSILFFRLKLVSDAMGFLGYAAFLCMIFGLYLQEAINPQALKTDCLYLTGKKERFLQAPQNSTTAAHKSIE